MSAAHWFLLSVLYWSASGLRLPDFEPTSTKTKQLAVELGAGSEKWSDHLSIGSRTSLVACENECPNKEFLIEKAAQQLNGRMSTGSDFVKIEDGGFGRDSVLNPMYAQGRFGFQKLGAWQPSLAEPGWWRLHSTFKKEASRYTPAEPGQHKLFWFGDSIVEQFRGTDLGFRKHDGWGPVHLHLANVSKVFKDTYGKAYPNPLAFGIWSDTYEQLYWRMEHGEISPAMANDPRLLTSMLVTHKTLVLSNQTVAWTSKGVIATARRFLQKTKGKLVINAYVAVASQYFNEEFTDKINAQVEDLTKTQLMNEFPGRVIFADCAGESRKYFKEKCVDKKQLKWDAKTNGYENWYFTDNEAVTYYDGCHPNYKGHKVIADCLIPKLKQLETLGA